MTTEGLLLTEQLTAATCNESLQVEEVCVA